MPENMMISDPQSLPPGWALIHPTMADINRVTDYLVSFDLATKGQPDTTVADVQHDWSRVGFDLYKDAYLILTPSGDIAGYSDFWLDHDELYISPNTNVHPDHRNDVSPLIFYRMGLERARQLGSDQVKRIKTISVVEFTEPILADEGFDPIQVQWRMEIKFNEPPQPPIWPDGYHLRPFDHKRDAFEVFGVIETAFQELPHRRGNTFEGWVDFILKRSDFEDDLLKTVVFDNEIVGVAVGFDAPFGGWVRQLAIKKSHRGHGLAKAILQQLFYEFARQGRDNVGLTVDSENRTGAPELYRRVGMHPVQKFVTYIKSNP